MIAAIVLFAAEAMTFTADRIAVDNVTKSLTATGHVHAAYGPLSLRSDRIVKDAEGGIRFSDPTTVTTCTNETCLAEGRVTHWRVTGDVEYREKDYVILRNAWLHFYEIPCFWLPYLYYPLESDCGFSWMPGYVGSWGAFLLTKYTYNLLGDPHHQDSTWWLNGDTRFDLRYKNGVAFGEDLFWNLGDFGGGRAQFYYAYDQHAANRYGDGRHWNSKNWGSNVESDRYGVGVEHRWDATERDVLRLRGNYYADSYFRRDFYRKSMFDLKTQWLAYENNGVFWEHVENDYSFGGEASGRLNEFYSMTERLPEFYFDVNPMSIFGLPLYYETENRLGWLQRRPAIYGDNDPDSVYSCQPGRWADYEAMRFDTYHRVSASFRTLDDVVAVSPRVGYHGTFWSASGNDLSTGDGRAGDSGNAFRSIGEVGATFAARGVAMVDESWRHMVEPYLDVLLQEAWYNGIGSGKRPYVFDSIDASSTWEDQFAGRSRNLPYSYYGATPGVRNAWDFRDEKGNFAQYLDFDVYLACQFNTTTYVDDWANDSHRLAELGKPNYGKSGPEFAPGFRIRWMPCRDSSLGVRGEYDSDNNSIAYAQVNWQQRVCKQFSYNVRYSLRNHRYWDFSSFPYREEQMRVDDMDMADLHMIDFGFTHHVCEWLEWGPHLRWDARANELDTVGTWIDYLTDCLGFRLLVEYENEYETIDGYTREDDWSVGFYVYLRAFGPESGSVFTGRGD